MSLRPEQEIRSDVRQPVDGTALDQRIQKAEVKTPHMCILGFTVYILAPLPRDSVFVAFIKDGATEAQIGQNTDPRPQST